MSENRKTLNISAETYEYLASVGERRDNESADAFLFRVAERLDEADDGMDVIECDIPEDVLTERHIDDIAERAGRKAAEDIEQLLR